MRRAATLESGTTLRPVIVTTTVAPSTSRGHGIPSSVMRSGSPIRGDPFRASEEAAQYYTQPATSARSRAPQSRAPFSPTDDEFLGTFQDRRTSARAGGDTYRSSVRPATVYATMPRYPTADIDYNNEYSYMAPGDLVREDLEHSSGRLHHHQHRRRESMDQGAYYRPSVNISVSSETARAYNNHGGPPPTTRGLDRANRMAAAGLGLYETQTAQPQRMPAAPTAPPPPQLHQSSTDPTSRGSTGAGGGADSSSMPPPSPTSRRSRVTRPVSLYQDSLPPRAETFSDDYYRPGQPRREAARETSRERPRDYHDGRDHHERGAYFHDPDVVGRGFGIRVDGGGSAVGEPDDDAKRRSFAPSHSDRRDDRYEYGENRPAAGGRGTDRREERRDDRGTDRRDDRRDDRGNDRSDRRDERRDDRGNDRSDRRDDRRDDRGNDRSDRRDDRRDDRDNGRDDRDVAAAATASTTRRRLARDERDDRAYDDWDAVRRRSGEKAERINGRDERRDDDDRDRVRGGDRDRDRRGAGGEPSNREQLRRDDRKASREDSNDGQDKERSSLREKAATAIGLAAAAVGLVSKDKDKDSGKDDGKDRRGSPSRRRNTISEEDRRGSPSRRRTTIISDEDRRGSPSRRRNTISDEDRRRDREGRQSPPERRRASDEDRAADERPRGGDRSRGERPRDGLPRDSDRERRQPFVEDVVSEADITDGAVRNASERSKPVAKDVEETTAVPTSSTKTEAEAAAPKARPEPIEIPDSQDSKRADSDETVSPEDTPNSSVRDGTPPSETSPPDRADLSETSPPERAGPSEDGPHENVSSKSRPKFRGVRRTSGFRPNDAASIMELKAKLAAMELAGAGASSQRAPPPPVVPDSGQSATDKVVESEKRARGDRDTPPSSDSSPVDAPRLDKGKGKEVDVEAETSPSSAGQELVLARPQDNDDDENEARGRELVISRPTERQVRVVSPAGANSSTQEPKPIKGILKPPRAAFPEEPNPIREGVAPHKDDKTKKNVPPGARWTKISRKIVNPEALTIGKERFEEREDHVIVLRVLNQEEIEAYALATKQLRGGLPLSSLFIPCFGA